MATPPKIYIESCPLIDLAKHKAKIKMASDTSAETVREHNVAYCKLLLQAALDGKVTIFASGISIAECTQTEPGVPSPDKDTQDFYDELLASGRSGIIMVQPTMTIMREARDLKWKNQAKLKGMDAIHLASAIHMGAQEFITTDGGIYKAKDVIKGIKIIQGHETTLIPHEYFQAKLIS